MGFAVLPSRPELSLAAIIAYATFTFCISLLLTPSFYKLLQYFRLGKQLRTMAADGGDASVFLKHHSAKAGTPTMGGLLIWGSILFTILFSRFLSLTGVIEFSLLQRGQVYLPLFALVTLGLLGAIDDYFNIAGIGKKRGLDALPKLLTLFIISAVLSWWFYARLGYQTVHVPFGEYIGIQNGILHLGWLYIPIFLFAFIGTANAVNVTDGLDGLAAGLLILAYGAFALIAYMKGLYILAGFCSVVVGAVSAFLWHNIPPALFFMGDTGSLALGGTLAVMAFMIDEVFALPIIGFMFVIEMLSVIIQLTSKRIRKKKVFRSAPIHHHFEALGWGESKVTMRFWIIGLFMAFLGILVVIHG